ncbi:hypothetical protein DB764_05640, partial [Xanthomonas perforans]
GLRATGARGLERPRCKRGLGRRAGVGVRIRGKAIRVVQPREASPVPSSDPFWGSLSRWEKETLQRRLAQVALSDARPRW